MRKEIEKYINEHYDTLQEYPWDEYPNYTTFKNNSYLSIKNKKRLILFRIRLLW